MGIPATRLFVSHSVTMSTRKWSLLFSVLFFAKASLAAPSDPERGHPILPFDTTTTGYPDPELSTQETSTETTEPTAEEAATEEPTSVQHDENPDLNSEIQTLVDKVESDDLELNAEDPEMEKWYLNRQNCNREVNVPNGITKNIAISFSPRETSEGQCQISINGPPHELLAILISNLHLSKENQESLRVVTRSRNINFTMKEFHDNETQLTLLLPDVRTVDLVFHYKTSGVPALAISNFTLQVFPYKIQSNLVKPYYGASTADNVYFTTEQAFFMQEHLRPSYG